MITSPLQITSVTYEVDFRVNVCKTIMCPNSLFFFLLLNEDLWKRIIFSISFYAYLNYLLFNKPPQNLAAQNKVWQTTMSNASLGWLGLAGQFWVKIFQGVSVWCWLSPRLLHAGLWLGTLEAGQASVPFHVASASSWLGGLGSQTPDVAFQETKAEAAGLLMS